MGPLEAAMWGALAASTLLIGAAITRIASPKPRPVALVMALGSGVLIASVTYDLVEEAITTPDLAGGSLPVLLLVLLTGALVFVLGARAIGRLGARRRNRMQGPAASDSGAVIAMGSVLDGVPESFVLGFTVLTGGVSMPLFAGIALSNLPESMASTSGLLKSGWPFRKVLGVWAAVVAASAAAAALGHLVLAGAPALVGAGAQAFAAGALLAMIVDTMVPDAYAIERDWTGLLVVVGFAGTLVISSL